MKELRIAMVAPSLEFLGGQGMQANILAENLSKEDCTVEFIPINPIFPARLRWLRRLPYVRTILNEVLYLAKLTALGGVDVVHVFSASYWSFLLAPVPAMVLARLFRKRVILNYHSGEAEDHLKRWGIWVHPWLGLAHEIVVPSEYLRQIFEHHGYRVRVVPNIVDTSRFYYRERFVLRPRLVSTRNLELHYRIDNTLKAFALVRAEYPEATLSIAGYGTEEPRLRSLGESLGSRGICFLNSVEFNKMPDLLDEADIFVNASVIDNQPVSILEALAAGLPIVSTATGDIGSMLCDGKAGVIVPPDDPVALGKEIIGLLKNPDRALILTRHGRKEVEKYQWSAVRTQWESVYNGRSA